KALSVLRKRDRKDHRDAELKEALEMWKESAVQLDLARKKFQLAQNSFETEAAIYEMGSAEARRSHALCRIRNITMARDIEENLAIGNTIARR
ncbi:MAG: hypothetical protein IKZ19_03695, partial [Clostridia bacterium]|nr:hypothetical protein [Clostridia bacterium]